jgi:hypothetical protein
MERSKYTKTFAVTYKFHENDSTYFNTKAVSATNPKEAAQFVVRTHRHVNAEVLNVQRVSE